MRRVKRVKFNLIEYSNKNDIQINDISLKNMIFGKVQHFCEYIFISH